MGMSYSPNCRISNNKCNSMVSIKTVRMDFTGTKLAMGVFRETKKLGEAG